MMIQFERIRVNIGIFRTALLLVGFVLFWILAIVQAIFHFPAEFEKLFLLYWGGGFVGAVIAAYLIRQRPSFYVKYVGWFGRILLATAIAYYLLPLGDWDRVCLSGLFVLVSLYGHCNIWFFGTYTLEFPSGLERAEDPFEDRVH